jgi:hypothetical protein
MRKTENIKRRKFLRKSLFIATGSLLAGPSISSAFGNFLSGNGNIKYITVASKKGRFMGWPANNGLWKWDNGREILVGFTNGNFKERDGHNIGEEELSNLARSTDGGKTWKTEDPKNFVGDDVEVKPSPGNIRFGHPDFALRVAAIGYHGTEDNKGRFFISYNRGKNWEGPYRFNHLNDDKNLEGMEITSRTNYRVTGKNSIQVFMSARRKDIEFASRLDKPFIAESTDGGKSFQFAGWAVPWTDQHRAVMPSVIRTGKGDLVMALRRRNPRNDEQYCWIDAFVSKDDGHSWSFLSKIGDTGLRNGNPPALAVLKDGRMACCFANRTTSKIYLRISDNDGASWDREIVVRDNPFSYDMGYPQLLQNNEGDLVALYYITTEESRYSRIEAAIINGL